MEVCLRPNLFTSGDLIVYAARYVLLRRRNARLSRGSRDSRRHLHLPRTMGHSRHRTVSASSLARSMIAVHPSDEALNYPSSADIASNRFPTPLETAHVASNALRQGARRGRRAARGADIDAGGRRGGRPEGESDDEFDDKEMLPAYESFAVGGPPRYEMDTIANPEGPIVITMPEPALVSSEDRSLSRSNVVPSDLGRDVDSRHPHPNPPSAAAATYTFPSS